MHTTEYPNSGRGQRVLIVFAILLTISSGIVHGEPSVSRLASPVPAEVDQKAFLCSLQDAFTDIAERAEPGVVSITAVQSAGVGRLQSGNTGLDGLDDLLKQFLGADGSPRLEALPFPGNASDGDEPSVVTASGSGAIIRRKGSDFYVLTNYHVVEDAYQVTVRLSDGVALKGVVVGVDSVTDLAVVCISSPKLSDRNIIPMGDSNDVKVGSWALAVGSPFGFDHSLTVGVVSALNRELEEDETTYPDLIQTDASINKGNSGGPLLNVEGQAIGVNSAIASPTGGFIGIGFAIPINRAKAVLDDLITSGRVVRGWMGIGIQDLTPVLSEYYGVRQGVLVASVDKNGPAARAGIVEEDAITSFGGARITDTRQLQRLVAAASPSRSIPVTAVSRSKERVLQVTIGLSPSTPSSRPSPPRVQAGSAIEVRTLPKDVAEQVGLKGVKGVIVVNLMPGSPADEAGLEEGDIIVGLNGRGVTSQAEFDDMLQRVRPGSSVVLKVVRRGAPRMIGFRVE